jgi:hypothetical protein
MGHKVIVRVFVHLFTIDATFLLETKGSCTGGTLVARTTSERLRNTTGSDHVVSVVIKVRDVVQGE